MALSLTYRSRVDMCWKEKRRSCDACVRINFGTRTAIYVAFMLFPSCLKRGSPIGIFFLKKSLSMLARRPPKKRDPPLCITSPPCETIRSPNDFLNAIGRKSETKMSFESWTQLWKTGGRVMRKAGVSVKDRRHNLSPLIYITVLTLSTTGISYGVKRNID